MFQPKHKDVIFISTKYIFMTKQVKNKETDRMSKKNLTRKV